MLLYTRRDGLVASLRTFRIRSNSDVVWLYVVRGDIANLKALFERGEASPSDIGATTQIGLLQSAIICKHVDMCQYLLQEGADPNLQVGTSASPSGFAWDMILADDGPTEVLSRYRQLFRDYCDLDDRGFTMLHRIVLRTDEKDLRKFLETCSQTAINHRDIHGYTPLHWAARGGDFKTINLLLREGADPNISTNLGDQALHFAARRGCTKSVNHLLRYGANVNARSNFQYTPLIYMISFQGRNLTCAKHLIDSGADINAQDFHGATVVIFASQYNFLPELKLFLAKGAKVDLPGLFGETALTVAIQSNAHGAVPILLAHGASLAQHTLSGRSLLHEAAEFGDEETLRLLTSARIRGVQVQRQCLDGNTAWDLARKRTDVTPEWRAAFADLNVSVDESVPELPWSARETLWKRFHIPSVRLSSMIRAVEDRVCEGVEGIQRLSSILVQRMAFLRVAPQKITITLLAQKP